MTDASNGRAALARALEAVLADLIAIPSGFPPGDTRAIAAFAARRLREAGYEVEVLSRKPGIDNVVARLGTGQPSLVFNAHADTVDVGERSNWRTDPYVATLKDGHVFGLGAGNCKGSMAAQLWLAGEIARRGGPNSGEVVFTFVGDEENLGPDGMFFLRESGKVRPDMLILGAQTDNQLMIAERGVMWAKVTTHGKAAHAGAPQNGDNAIMRMVRLIGELQSRLLPVLIGREAGTMQSTINVGKINGGHNTNVVPSLCTMEIDRRLLPNETVGEAFEELVRVLKGGGQPPGSYEVELLRGTDGFQSRADGPLVQAFRAEIAARTNRTAQFLNATGVSDGRYFAGDNVAILNFGPGSGAQGHAANESVPVEQMVDAALIQLGVVERLLGLGR